MSNQATKFCYVRNVSRTRLPVEINLVNDTGSVTDSIVVNHGGSVKLPAALSISDQELTRLGDHIKVSTDDPLAERRKARAEARQRLGGQQHSVSNNASDHHNHKKKSKKNTDSESTTVS